MSVLNMEAHNKSKKALSAGQEKSKFLFDQHFNFMGGI